MISKVAEHSIDVELLPKEASIMDLGCRGFEFALAMVQMGHNVCAVDIDELQSPPLTYQHCAISDFDGICGVIRNNDAQATRISKIGNGIECYTLKSFSERVGVEFWDLIKMDVEGSEYEIIMSLEKAPAKQLSIEFHLHTGVYKISEMNAMENKLKALGYETMKHEYTHDFGAGLNYWDSLFILK